MLIQIDRNELGDKRLNPEEAVAREREELLKQAAVKKIWRQEELEQAERSCGPRLHWTEILRRLLRINPQLAPRDGLKGHVAIYRRKRQDEYDIAEFDPMQKDSFFWDHVYVTGMPMGELPEYSHVILDSSNLPVREIRGWRTVLIALIKSGAISYAAAIREFGDPIHDQRSGLWFDQLQKFVRSSN